MHTGFQENAEWSAKIDGLLKLAETRDGRNRVKADKWVAIPLARMPTKTANETEQWTTEQWEAAEKAKKETCDIYGPNVRGPNQTMLKPLKYRGAEEAWDIEEISVEKHKETEEIQARVSREIKKEKGPQREVGIAIICIAKVKMGSVRTPEDKMTHQWAVLQEEEWASKMMRGRCRCWTCRFEWFHDGWTCPEWEKEHQKQVLQDSQKEKEDEDMDEGQREPLKGGTKDKKAQDEENKRQRKQRYWNGAIEPRLPKQK